MARQFKILTDTGCDLPAQYFADHDVSVARLGFILDGVTYGGDEGADMDVHEFYDRLRGGAMPKTFQITSAQAEAHISRLAESGNDVLVLAFSSGLSGTYESFLAAAKTVAHRLPNRKIVVIDSLCASLGEGLLLDYLVKKADEGATIEETAAYVEELRPHLCHFFTVENLYHLKRGGRVSATTAFVGTVLNIKPVLHVDDAGHLVPVGKAMGRKKSIAAIVEKMRELRAFGDTDPLFISHGDCPEDAEYLKQLVLRELGERQIFVGEIGSVIGTHSGAGTLALFFLGEHR